MLEKLIALYRKNKEKELILKGIKAEYDAKKREVEEEFGDTDAAVREEKQKVSVWMKENGFKTHIEPDGMVELRDSAPKYVVKDDKLLLRFLMTEELIGALEYKKSIVNALAKEKSIPENLIEIQVEPELAVTTVYPKE